LRKERRAKPMHELRRTIVAIGRTLKREGLITWTAGNISARIEGNAIVITPSGIDYDQLKPEDLVVLDLEGKRLEGRWRPSTEWPMHTYLYKHRPDIGALIHTHSPYATTLACLELPIPPVHYLAAAVGGKVSVARYATYGTPDMGKEALKALGRDGKAALLAQHGVICAGVNLREAWFVVVTVEYIARIYWQCLSVGKPKPLTDEQIEAVRLQLQSYGQVENDGLTPP
jgi:L-fuculose-phosphate aldolase